jgi:glycosyltransferase involved in cell wall biosynthesis
MANLYSHILLNLYRNAQQCGITYATKCLYQYGIKLYNNYTLAKKAIPLRSIFPIASNATYAQKKLTIFQSLHATILIDHSCGGGANAFSQQWIKRHIAEGGAVGRWIYLSGLDMYLLQLESAHHRLFIKEHSFERIAQCVQWLSPCKLLVNELVSWPQIGKILSFLQSLDSVPLEVWVHDYFCVCPSYSLMNSENKYCRVPEIAICDHCLPRNSNVPAHTPTSIMTWRKQWSEFLKHAVVIYVPDKSVQDIVEQVYPNLHAKLQVVPHAPLAQWLPLAPPKQTTPPVIGVIGHITRNKGARIVQDLVAMLEDHHSEARVVVVGEFDLPTTSAKLIVTKSYSHSSLPEIITAHGITVGLVPSLCPETFSYTALEITQLGLPLVCFDLGAQAQRANQYQYGFIAKTMDARGCLQACLLAHETCSALFRPAET